MTTDYSQVVAGLRKVFRSGRTKDIEWRKRQLRGIIKFLEQEKDGIAQALKKDLNKSKQEGFVFENLLCQNDAIDALNNLEEWTAPQKVKKPLVNMSDDCFIRYEPLGVSLIIGAWNYPIQLTLLPLIGAVAAGNCVILKPSEVAEATALLLENTLPKYIDNEAIKVINGGVSETTALLKERFDQIFYTGNSAVGKIVMEAASKHLTAVVLELGGKSPTYVDPSSDLNVVAKRVIWGKFANAGQTCVAPDYILCTKDTQEKLLTEMKKVVEDFYGKNPQESPDYGRVINNRHFKRLSGLISPDKVAIGGKTDEKDNYVAPTILRDVKPDDPCMQQEIFGPVLPIMTIQDHDEAIEFINSREKPLALYVFSRNDAVTKKITSSCSSGGLCVNDVLMHAGVDTIPFGGVGCSGMGNYHGKFSFEAFSHKRGCMIRQQKMESLNSLRCPPFTDSKLGWMVWVMKKSEKKSGIRGFLPIIILGVVAAFVFKLLGLQNYFPKGLTQ